MARLLIAPLSQSVVVAALVSVLPLALVPIWWIQVTASGVKAGVAVGVAVPGGGQASAYSTREAPALVCPAAHRSPALVRVVAWRWATRACVVWVHCWPAHAPRSG